MKRATILLAILWVIAGCLPVLAQTTETHSYTAVNKPIPDGKASGLSQVQPITSSIVSLGSVRVQLHIVGEFNGDLYGYLRHVQNGVTNFSVLLNRTGRTTANSAGYADSGFDVTFDDGATLGDIHNYGVSGSPAAGTPLTGTWRPDGRWVDPGVALDTSPRTATLSQFAGAPASGQWTLYLADLVLGGTNMLASWGLELSGIATPTVTWPTPADIGYGTALGAGQLNATAAYNGSSVPGTFAYSPPAGTVLNSGISQTLTAVFTPTDTATYSSVTKTVSINVAKAPLTVTANDGSRAYGDSNPTFTGTISGVQNGDTITATYSTVANLTSPWGSYPIVPLASGSRLSNYTVGYVNGTLTVSKAMLTVTAADKSRAYGSANPVFTGTITGQKNGDVITATYTSSATITSPAGPYAITPQLSGAALSNYTQTINNGTLLVAPAPLSVTAQNASRVYGAPNPSFTGTVVGILNNDSLTVSYTTAAGLLSPVGAYDIVPSVSGAAAGNYTVQVTNGTLSVTQATSAGAVTSSSNPALPGQSVTFTMTVSAVSPSTGTPAGTVQFKIDGSAAGSPVTLAGGVAHYSTSALSHASSHSVVAEYSGNLNFLGTTSSLLLPQVINTPPVAVGDTVRRLPASAVKVSIAALLSNDTDADGDTITFVGVNTGSPSHGTVARDGNWIYYTPTPGYTSGDMFAYTISDGFGTAAAGSVTVTVYQDTDPSPNLAAWDLGNGTFAVHGDGIPNRTYQIEFTLSLQTPSWQWLGTATADQYGTFDFIDLSGSSSRSYRSVYP